MSKIKIAVIGVLTTALVVSGAAGGILYTGIPDRIQSRW